MDRVFLDANVLFSAAYLLTGDLRHFGPLIGHIVEGVRIERPATCLGREAG